MKYLLTFNEKITLDIGKGSVIFGGRFKNKRTVVKSTSKDDKGEPLVNGKPLLKYKIKKKDTKKSESVE